MEYAIISIALVSKCLYCKTQSCWYCTYYGTNEKIIKIESTASTYTQILSEYSKLNKTSKNIKYQIHKIEQLEPNETKEESEYIYAILETACSLKNLSLHGNEIIYYSPSLKQIQKIRHNIVKGKIRPESHVGHISFDYLHMWKEYKISKKQLPTYANVQ